ncbi:glycosyltransferase [Vibrio cholerae]
MSKWSFFLNTINFGGAEQYVYEIAKQHLNANESNTSNIVSKGGVKSDELKSVRQSIVSLPMIRIGKDSIKELSWKQQLFLKLFPITKWLYYLLLKNKIKGSEVIISQHGFPTILADFISKKLRIKHINIVHHVIPNEYTRIYNDFDVKPENYVAVSEEVKEYLISSHNINPADISVIMNPIALSTRCSNSQDKISISMISHVHADKKQSVISFCDLSLNPKYSEYRFNLAGDYNNDVGREIHEIYHNSVHFVGPLASKNYEDFICNSKLVVAVGRSAIEPAIRGVPVIICGHVPGKFGGNYGGVISKNNLSELSAYNYSGRNSSDCTSTQLLENSIDEIINSAVEHDDELLELLQSKHSPDKVYRQFKDLA